MNKTYRNVIVIKVKYKIFNLVKFIPVCVCFFFLNFLTLKDLGGTTHIYIYVYDTEYDGKGKVQIPPPPKKIKVKIKIIKIQCEITHWNQLRLAIKMTKTQKLPESGSAPWTLPGP